MRLELATNYRPYILATTGIREADAEYGEDKLYYHSWYKSFVDLANYKIYLKYGDMSYQKNANAPA